MNEQPTSQHFRFLERLRASGPGTFVVGAWLHGKGYGIEIPALQFAPTAAHAPKFSDGGDVFATKPGGPRLRVEVKTLGFSFTGKDDWPFSEFFIATAEMVDRIINDVHAWVCVSQDFCALGIVNASTKDRWHLSTKRMANTGNEEEKYAAPLDVVKWVNLKTPAGWSK